MHAFIYAVAHFMVHLYVCLCSSRIPFKISRG